MKKLVYVLLMAGLAVEAATPARNVAGASTGGNSPYATDAYPGFDGLDDVKKPERREKSWWFGVKRETPAEQLAYARELEAAGDFKGAAKANDALVREWPASKEAPQAQLRFVQLLATELEDYEEAFDQLEYLLDFYSRDCQYLELVEYGYKLVNTMVEKKKSWFGFSFLSNRLVRQHYESIVRRAPGAPYVPEALLKIADLREQDSQYEESVKVYATLQNSYPVTVEARQAAYREAAARMWLCRRLAYNISRCRDTEGYLKMTIQRLPDLEQIEELKGWMEELKNYMAEDAYQRAKFYDTKQRTRHAARAALERFLAEYPDSAHADEARARIAELADPVPAAAGSASEPNK
ncbi:MAG: tetratricopeptide repeat protein [Kiritimatiellia bacterium]